MTTVEPDWEERNSQLWATVDEHTPEEFMAHLEVLVAELSPDSAVRAFELGSANDSTGRSDLAVPLYQQALSAGLTGERRRRATIQLASSLRNIGRAEEGLRLLSAERHAGSDDLDDAVIAFLALMLVDLGRAREAAALTLSALAGHLHRYRRSVDNYAREILADDSGPTATQDRTGP